MSETANDGRPKTIEEFSALPIGPEFKFGEHVLTEEDMANGYIMVGDKRHNIVTPCRSVRWPIPPNVVAHYVTKNDINGYRDAEHGDLWSLGLYADGSWFRKRANQ